MALKINAVGGDEIKAAADALRKVDKSLPGKMRYLIEKDVRPIIAEEKAGLRGLNTSGVSGHTGLRRKLAVGVGVKVRSGSGRRGRPAAIRIVTKVPDRSLAMLPRGLDAEFGGWRAPLFGNKEYWYHHETRSGYSWFMGPPQKHGHELYTKINKILQSSAEEIARAAIRARTR